MRQMPSQPLATRTAAVQRSMARHSRDRSGAIADHVSSAGQQPAGRPWHAADAILLVAALCWLILVPLRVMAMLPEDKPEGPFAERDLTGWKERSFKGNTDYQLVEDQGVVVLRARTDGQASVLYRESTVDVAGSPWLEWSWKIDGVYRDIDEQTRDGDDFPARLYVVVKTGVLPWHTRAINYVWASEAAVDAHWPNPFTNKAHMVVVHSGNDDAGTWVHERRDVVEDFKRYHGIDITQLDGYAVMADGDNGNRSGTAWFGQIRFGDT